MNLPTALLTIQWMVRDTFRQSLASRLFWVVLGMSVICILFCLSVGVTDGRELPSQADEPKFSIPKNDPKAKDLGPDALEKEGIDIREQTKAKLSLGFGLFDALEGKNRTDAVRFLQIWLAGAVADTAGIFLVLIWTAGFLPTFLDPNQVTVLLAKPVPRWSLLIGKYLGVIAFVVVQGTFSCSAPGWRSGCAPAYLTRCIC